MKNELLNLSATANKIGVPIKWLRDKAISNEIPCLKIKSRFLFNIEAVRQALFDLAAKGENNE
jgi:hypothetical protein